MGKCFSSSSRANVYLVDNEKDAAFVKDSARASTSASTNKQELITTSHPCSLPQNDESGVRIEPKIIQSQHTNAASTHTPSFLEVPKHLIATAKPEVQKKPRPPELLPFSPFNAGTGTAIATSHDQWRPPQQKNGIKPAEPPQAAQAQRIEVNVGSINTNLPLPLELGNSSDEDSPNISPHEPGGLPYFKPSQTRKGAVDHSAITSAIGAANSEFLKPKKRLSKKRESAAGEARKRSKAKPPIASYRMHKNSPDASRPTTASDSANSHGETCPADIVENARCQPLQQYLRNVHLPPQRTSVRTQNDFDYLNIAHQRDTQGSFEEELIHYHHAQQNNSAGNLDQVEEENDRENIIALDPAPLKKNEQRNTISATSNGDAMQKEASEEKTSTLIKEYEKKLLRQPDQQPWSFLRNNTTSKLFDKTKSLLNPLKSSNKKDSSGEKPRDENAENLKEIEGKKENIERVQNGIGMSEATKLPMQLEFDTTCDLPWKERKRAEFTEYARAWSCMDM